MFRVDFNVYSLELTVICGQIGDVNGDVNRCGREHIHYRFHLEYKRFRYGIN